MSADEELHYRMEHMKIFGHAPMTLIGAGKRCSHPMHDQIQRLLDAPGVDIEIPFESRTMHTEDDAHVIAAKQAYDDRVQQIREQIAEAEEEDAFEARENKKRLF